MGCIRRASLVSATLGLMMLLSATIASLAEAKVDPSQNAAQIAKIVNDASPAVKKMIAELPRSDRKMPKPGDVEVPKTSNPIDPLGTAAVKRFQQGSADLLYSKSRSSADPDQGFPKQYVESNIPGVGKGQRGSDGMIRVKEADGYLYTHGPDPVPAEAGTASSAGIPLPTNGSLIAPFCSTGGREIKIVHAYTEDSPPDGLTLLNIWTAVLRANTKLVHEALRSSGNTRLAMMKVPCRENYSPAILAGMPEIQLVEVPNYVGTTVNNTVRSSLGTPWGPNTKKYLTFVKGSDPSGLAAGIAYTGGHLMFSQYDQKDEDSYHAWNTATMAALVYGPYWSTHATLHELFHLFGAVNYEGGSYFGTGGGHCFLGYAVMCYDDNNPPHQTSPRGDAYPLVVCNDTTPAGFALDCGYDTLFRTKHVTSGWSWLQLRRNTGGAENSFLAYYPPWDYSPPCTNPFLC